MKLTLLIFIIFFILFVLIHTETIEDCQDLNLITYEKCSSKRNCNLCALSIYCGWCLSTQQCTPINADDKKPLCNENCEEILPLENCYKAYTKVYGEEIDLTDGRFNKPQFTPSKYEKREFNENMEEDIENYGDWGNSENMMKFKSFEKIKKNEILKKNVKKTKNSENQIKAHLQVKNNENQRNYQKYDNNNNNKSTVQLEEQKTDSLQSAKKRIMGFLDNLLINRKVA